MDALRDADDLCMAHVVDLAKVNQADLEMPDAQVLTGLAETFKILANPNRLRMIHALASDELCVCDLAALLRTTESAVSHQLRLLRNTRLVKFRRQGKLAYYSLDDKHVEQLFQAGLEHLLEPSSHVAGGTE